MATTCLLCSFISKTNASMTTADRAVLAIQLYTLSQGLRATAREGLADWKVGSGYHLRFIDQCNREIVFDLSLSDGVNLSVHARTAEGEDFSHAVLFLKQLEGLDLDKFWVMMLEKIFPRYKRVLLETLEVAGSIALISEGCSDRPCCLLAEGHRVSQEETEAY
jgi:hypothetical protein